MAAISSAAGILTGVVATLAVATATAQPPCAGDCNGDGVVSIDELVTGVALSSRRGRANAPRWTAIRTARSSSQSWSRPSASRSRGAGVRRASPSRVASTSFRANRAEQTSNPFSSSRWASPSSSGVIGEFHFENIPPGDYTLSVVQGCNPFGCWPSVAVTVTDQDVFVHMDLNPAPTPTPTPNVCGDEAKARLFAQCVQATTESDCVERRRAMGSLSLQPAAGVFLRHRAGWMSLFRAGGLPRGLLHIVRRAE